MRVLYWAPLFLPDIGGIEIWSSRFLPAMQARGHEFMILASPTRRRVADIDSFAGIPVLKLPFEHALHDQDMPAIKRILLEIGSVKKRFQPDLVHIHTSLGGAYFQLMTRSQHPSPMLLSLHYFNIAASAGENSLMGQLLHASDHVAAVSAFMRNCGVGLVPSITGRSSVILNGVPPASIAPLPLPFDPPRLLTYGRVVAEKGFDIALQALALVREQRPDAHLVVAGDGNALLDLVAQAAGLGLREAVEFTGWIDATDIPELINTATMVLVPSRWDEPFGLVAVEAAQMGRPVIAANAGGLGEVVAHGVTGLLVPREDPAAMAGAILSLLSDPIRTEEMARAARERARTVFSFEHMIDAYENLYAQLAPPPQ